ncbi:Aste57867_25068 [Aphanomyces stellatus]|uniref:Aste57867_25068 protein n=1 Tax=Aphanomyces stellatus TaxID=120398 RepID=A0A485LWK8_9STRA|nr:hypothetical protein As57867_024990 [Aphanomyces stellatus]VFU01699.1 Aste57867_25068 [Aphanomyces stellatus]
MLSGSNNTLEKVHPEAAGMAKAPATARVASPPTAKRPSDVAPPYGSGREAACFLVFLVLFLVVTAYNHSPTTTFFFGESVRRAVAGTLFPSGDGSGIAIAYDSMQTIPDVWNWVQGPLVQTLYSIRIASPATNGSNTTSSQTVALANVRVGGVRLRQIRVAPNSCTVQDEYSPLVAYCYGPLTYSTESSAGFGPVQNSYNVSHAAAYVFASTYFGPSPTYANLMTCISACGVSVGSIYGLDKARYKLEYSNECSLSCTCFYSGASCAAPPGGTPAPLYTYTWTPPVEPSLMGLFGDIPGSGFVIDLPPNATAAIAAVQQLQRQNFLDVGSRALVVEFAVFNPTLQLVDNVQLVVEFPPTGGVAPSMTASILDLSAYSSSAGGKVFFEAALVVCVVIYAGEILVRVYRHNPATLSTGYFDSGWNQLHGVNIALFVAVITLRLLAINLMYGSGAVNIVTATNPTDVFAYLRALATLSVQERSINAVNAVLIWLGLLKYTQMSRRMYFVVRMLCLAVTDLLSAILLFFICLLGYAQAGFLAFSTDAPAFRTFGQSLVSVFQALTFRFDYHDLVQANPGLAPVYLITFYILLVLVCVNIFVAVLHDAFTTAHKQQSASSTTLFPFAHGLAATLSFWLKREWVAIKFGRAAAAKLEMDVPKKPLRQANPSDDMAGTLHPYMAMEMQALSEKLTLMMKAHDDKRGKLDGIESMLRAIEDTCMELKVDKTTGGAAPV